MKIEPTISAVVLTYDEEDNIGRCLESVVGYCPAFVVDSGSTDRTIEVCHSFGAQVISHAYENHASQWQWALENLPLESEWVLVLDADFAISEALKKEIETKLPLLDESVAGVFVRHTYVFGGNRIHHGGIKRDWLRIVRRSRARVDNSDLVDFRFVLAGTTARFQGEVVEHNVHDDDISWWTEKQQKFALRLAVEEELRRRGLLEWEIEPRLFGHSDERAAWLRDRWLQMPLFVRPVFYFVYRYFVRLGFLDGRGGFLYHVLQGFWLRLVVDWKIREVHALEMNDKELKAFRNAMLTMRTGSVAKILDEVNTRAGSESVSAIKG